MIAVAPPRQTALVPALIQAVLVAFLGVSVVSKVSVAQTTLTGRVLDSEVGTPLAGATVRIDGHPSPLVTDSLGQFRARELRTGEIRVTIEVLGYIPGVFRVPIPASGDVDRDFPLDFTGHRLPDVVVRARAEQLMSRYVDFERRRERKVGAYFRWDELKSYGSVGDALRTVRGVRIQCDQKRFECFAVMARTPHCQPTWWIDGVEAGSFHENTPIRDIYGIEIYRGAGEIPGEFAGSNAGCGVIVMWTKSRPFINR